MRVLIVGSGGREYSIGLALKNDKNVKEIFFAPGNGATSKIGFNLPIIDHEILAKFALQNQIDLTIIGPEEPLVLGIVDLFKDKGLTIFGPSKKAAQLEGSKVFMKEFLSKYDIPTARFLQTSSLQEADDFIQTLNEPIVVKADGLCAGKGVIIAKSKSEALKAAEDMLLKKSFGDAGEKIVIEEFLDGYELSIFAICDGDDFIVLPAAQDHKRLLDHDEGPNTGGMGAYAPTPLVDDLIYEDVKKYVIKPTLEGMKKEGSPYNGVLFIGLMIVDKKVFVLEYNVRFGDPECEVLMPLIKSSVSDMFYKSAKGDIKSLHIDFHKLHAVGVVMASENYPYKSSKPSQITLKEFDSIALKQNTHISYAGVSKNEDKLFASGGRVLVCVGLGESINLARDRAYKMCEQVDFEGKKFRHDIGYQAIK